MRRRKLIIVLSFMLATLLVLCVESEIKRRRVAKRMLEYALLSSRELDGAANLAVMNGDPGFIGYTNVYLDYSSNGYITLSGDNELDSSGWKLISEFDLEPGHYSLSGLRGAAKETVELQLSVWNEEKQGYDYFRQYDEDVSFELKEKKTARLHVRVYPLLAHVQTEARPAVYKDE